MILQKKIDNALFLIGQGAKELHRERQDLRREADNGTIAGIATTTTAGRRNGRFTILI